MSEAPADLGSPVGTLTLAQLAERISHEREMRVAQEKSLADALHLQATEVERRLQVLNGEYGRIDKVLEATIPREVYATAHEALKTRVDTLERSDLTRATREQERDRATVRTMALIGLVATVISVILSVAIRLGIG